LTVPDFQLILMALTTVILTVGVLLAFQLGRTALVNRRTATNQRLINTGIALLGGAVVAAIVFLLTYMSVKYVICGIFLYHFVAFFVTCYEETRNHIPNYDGVHDYD